MGLGVGDFCDGGVMWTPPLCIDVILLGFNQLFSCLCIGWGGSPLGESIVTCASGGQMLLAFVVLAVVGWFASEFFWHGAFGPPLLLTTSYWSLGLGGLWSPCFPRFCFCIFETGFRP